MKVLITGAAGFIGQLLAKELLADPEHELVLVDIVEPPVPAGCKYPGNAKTIKTDLTKSASTIITPDIDAVYVFHGIMSAGAEANFELGMSANIDATRALFEAIRLSGKPTPIRVLYASSQAVYGMPTPDIVTEAVVPTPESSYGAQKLICEALINDYTRRGFFDGFAFRFPTISVRPGKPTAAASSFLSGMIREPLNGLPCEIPIENRKFAHWICSPRTLVANLIYALTMPSDAAPKHIRVVNLPGIGVTVQEMIDALEAIGGKEAVALLSEKDVPELREILYSWPPNFDNKRAYDMGFKPDQPFVDTVKDYYENFVKK
ncbi:putative nucleoside-diphosphate-sugar epimerase [Myxozyma melibiosi]|uniref:Nucleoside-diphosphate-sugar epimerase n=1 Tax=Myxozyma melibiosi TaxID=54550 RepID=A0ABR1F0Q1_9ASCO